MVVFPSWLPFFLQNPQKTKRNAKRSARKMPACSFLYYVPYVTLAVMTFPSILSATQSPIAAAVALVAAIALAWLGKGLFFVAVSSCVIVFVLEFLIKFIVG